MRKLNINPRVKRWSVALLIVFTSLSSTGCSQAKNLFNRLSKKGEVEAVSPQTVEELRVSYIEGDMGALEELIAIYQDEEQHLDVRKSAVRAMAETQHPLALDALAEYVKKAKALNIELMITSVGVLSEFQEDPVASGALMESIFAVDDKLRQVQAATFKSLKNVKPENKVLALIDIYERSRAAFYSTATMVSNTLASMDENEVVPVLIFLAKDESLDVKTRNRSLEILAGRKNDARIVGMFVEMLTDPSMESQIRDFAIHTMKDVKEERLILALLDTYSQGQASYYSLLSTLLDALGNFNDPVVKPTLVEIAMQDDVPRSLRVKAILNLGNFRDPGTFELILPMLEDPESYEYYPYIIELAHTLGAYDTYKTKIRNAGLIAQEKALEASKLEK
jgi:HEAT repeat protein